MYKLYKLTNRTSGKSYIGFTKSTVEFRFNLHVGAAQNPKYPIQYAIAKYGADDFTIETLCIGSKKYITSLEQPAIELFESHVSKNGYNVADGGCGGNLGKIANKKRSITKQNFSEEKKQELAEKQRQRQLGKTKYNDAGRLAQSIAVKGNKFAQGLVHTEETKQIISEANTGPKSQITRQRMSQSAIINHNGKRFGGRNACCLCCKKEWDVGNYTQHIKRNNNNELQQNKV